MCIEFGRLSARLNAITTLSLATVQHFDVLGASLSVRSKHCCQIAGTALCFSGRRGGDADGAVAFARGGAAAGEEHGGSARAASCV